MFEPCRTVTQVGLNDKKLNVENIIGIINIPYMFFQTVGVKIQKR